MTRSRPREDLNLISQTMSDQVVAFDAPRWLACHPEQSEGSRLVNEILRLRLRMTPEPTRALDRLVLTCLTILDHFHIEEV